MPRTPASSPVARNQSSTSTPTPAIVPSRSAQKIKKAYRVRFANDDESSSEDDEEQGASSDNASEADRILRGQHAEEIERYIEEERSNLARLLTEFPSSTKLTRRKARELNHDIVQILNLGGVSSHGDNSSILEGDFAAPGAEDEEDEDDDEYQPNENEEDDASDDYSELTNTLSQPNTPGSALDDSLNSSNPQFDADEGLFKVPTKDPPITPIRAQNISKRTRSKLSYTATPIEEIGTRLPLDFAPEPCDNEADPDESWQEFLKDFQTPLHFLKEEDDDGEEETDPEYVAQHELGDVDEAEDVPITQDEVHALIDELLDGIDVEYDPEDDFIPTQTTNPKCNFNPSSVFLPNSPQPQSNDPQWSLIQPVAIVQTSPPIGPQYELVLGADEQMYVLPRSYLRQLVPGLFRKPGPAPSPMLRVDITRDTTELLQDVLDHRLAHDEYLSFIHEHLRPRLQVQMMRYTQLLGQCFVQTYGHIKWWSFSDFFLRKLRDLQRRAVTSASVRELCWNLDDVHSRCMEWVEELRVDNQANREYNQFMVDGLKGLDKAQRYPLSPRVMEFIVNAKGFVFPQLLPQYRIKEGIVRCLLVPGEIRLLTMCYEDMLQKTPLINVKAVAEAYSRHYAPWRLPVQLQKYFFMEQGKPPRVQLVDGRAPKVEPEPPLEWETYEDVIMLAQRDRGTLPKRWNKYLFSKERFQRVFPDWVQPKGTSVSQSEAVEKADTPPPGESAGNGKGPVVTLDFKDFKAQFDFDPNLFAAANNNKHSRASVGQRRGEERKAQRRSGRRRSEFKCKVQTVIQRLVSGKRLAKSKCFEELRTRRHLTKRLHAKLLSFHAEYEAWIEGLGLRADSPLLRVFEYFREFDVYARVVLRTFLADLERENEPTTMIMAANSSPSAKRAKLDDASASAAVPSTPAAAAPPPQKQSREAVRRLKAEKLCASNRLLLTPESTETAKERDSLFAWNFMYKVRETFVAEGRPEKMQQFLAILKDMKATDSVPELYKRIEAFFLPSHPELVDIFLYFLLPGHAAQVGKFVEHFLVTDMSQLVAKLKLYFEKQPKQWKKVMIALAELSQEHNPTMATIKNRFLPLLKGNPLLVHWFLQLFPDEPPVDSREDEFEQLRLANDAAAATEHDFEEVPASLIPGNSDVGGFSGCPIRYQQGRIQYGSKYVLPANIKFMATSYVLDGGERERGGRGKRGTVSGGEENQQPQTGCVHAVGGRERDRLSEERVAMWEEPLCDKSTLQAHKSRLNPGVEANQSSNSGQSGSGSQSEEKKSGSPGKRGVEWKTVSITRTSRARRRVVGTSHHSPTQSRSPKKGRGSPKKGGSEKNKRKRPNTGVTNNNSSNNKKESPPVRKEEGEGEAEEEGGQSGGNGQGEEENPGTSVGEGSSEEWTRDEDKVILLAINGQEEDKTEEQILDGLQAAISGRSRAEIETRFQFLIKVLREFSG